MLAGQRSDEAIAQVAASIGIDDTDRRANPIALQRLDAAERQPFRPILRGLQEVEHRLLVIAHQQMDGEAG